MSEPSNEAVRMARAVLSDPMLTASNLARIFDRHMRPERFKGNTFNSESDGTAMAVEHDSPPWQKPRTCEHQWAFDHTLTHKEGSYFICRICHQTRQAPKTATSEVEACRPFPPSVRNPQVDAMEGRMTELEREAKYMRSVFEGFQQGWRRIEKEVDAGMARGVEVVERMDTLEGRFKKLTTANIETLEKVNAACEAATKEPTP